MDDYIDIEDMYGPDDNFDSSRDEAPVNAWPVKPPGQYRNQRYGGAYGNYRGGYGPSGSMGRGPPPLFGPRGDFPPRSAPPPGFPPSSWGRGFGPRGPPNRRGPYENKVIKYLLKCGVTKDNLKNLPLDLLELYEPERCGLCAFNLESFAVSRMHYISKNHLKNQKKWLSKNSEAGYRHAKEQIPFKARELYCELCDVHITSKTHSESHYAGKPHRSIVEGRKNPRNPFLLQKGMQDRLDQLIRREKKHYKSEDSEKPDELKPKSFQAELYCDICKTSVTCSEQMTMHLNGKRHLAKEKQHILKMMKGGGADVKEEKAFNDDGQVEDEEQIQEDNATGNTDDYDWGNGSGTWDEPETAE